MKVISANACLCSFRVNAILTPAPRWQLLSSGSFYVLLTRHLKRPVNNAVAKALCCHSVTCAAKSRIMNIVSIHSAPLLIIPGTHWMELPAFSIATNTSPAGQSSSVKKMSHRNSRRHLTIKLWWLIILHKYFVCICRVSIKESSVAKLGSVCRRIYRIFSHAYFHHRQIFDKYEVSPFRTVKCVEKLSWLDKNPRYMWTNGIWVNYCEQGILSFLKDR